jgi:hypothetical protein
MSAIIIELEFLTYGVSNRRKNNIYPQVRFLNVLKFYFLFIGLHICDDWVTFDPHLVKNVPLRGTKKEKMSARIISKIWAMPKFLK